MSQRRTGFTLVELLIVVGIIAVLIGMLLPALSLVQEASWRSQCVHNLRQMGMALNLYESTHGSFPVDDPQLGRVMYVAILPFLEEKGQDPADPGYVSQFVCASRHDARVGPWSDWAARHHAAQLDAQLSSGYASFQWVSSYFKRSVLGLGGPAWRGVSRDRVARCDGIANTLLLSHKFMQPSDYYPGPNIAAGTTWASPVEGGADYWRNHRTIGEGCASAENSRMAGDVAEASGEEEARWFATVEYIRIETTAPHGLGTGDTVRIQGNSYAAANGTFEIWTSSITGQERYFWLVNTSGDGSVGTGGSWDTFLMNLYAPAPDTKSFAPGWLAPQVNYGFGSPHSRSMPYLFADGSARDFAYVDPYAEPGSLDVLERMWFWNDSEFRP